MNDGHLDVSKTTFKLVYASSDGGGGELITEKQLRNSQKVISSAKVKQQINSANSCYGF